MFVQDRARHAYPHPQRRRGWGRIAVLAAALLLATRRLAFGRRAAGAHPADGATVTGATPPPTTRAILGPTSRPSCWPTVSRRRCLRPDNRCSCRASSEHTRKYDEHIAGQSGVPGAGL